MTGVIQLGELTGFAGSNGMAFILLVLLVAATLAALMGGKVKNEK